MAARTRRANARKSTVRVAVATTPGHRVFGGVQLVQRSMETGYAPARENFDRLARGELCP